MFTAIDFFSFACCKFWKKTVVRRSFILRAHDDGTRPSTISAHAYHSAGARNHLLHARMLRIYARYMRALLWELRHCRVLQQLLSSDCSYDSWWHWQQQAKKPFHYSNRKAKKSRLSRFTSLQTTIMHAQKWPRLSTAPSHSKKPKSQSLVWDKRHSYHTFLPASLQDNINQMTGVFNKRGFRWKNIEGVPTFFWLRARWSCQIGIDAPVLVCKIDTLANMYSQMTESFCVKCKCLEVGCFCAHVVGKWVLYTQIVPSCINAWFLLCYSFWYIHCLLQGPSIYRENEAVVGGLMFV